MTDELKTRPNRKEININFARIPIDSALHNIMDGDENDLRGRCSALVALYITGKKEAALVLYGLMYQNYNNIVRKNIIINALGNIKTMETANILFKELKDIESNRTTRTYIDEILNCLKGFPKDIIKDGFQALLNDKKWSVKMRNKFEEIYFRKFISV